MVPQSSTTAPRARVGSAAEMGRRGYESPWTATLDADDVRWRFARYRAQCLPPRG
jgi:hypothetical protein